MAIRKPALSALAVGLVGSLALSACGGDSEGGDGKVTLQFTWWGAEGRAERYEEAIDIFEQQNPDIEVQTSFAEFADYWTQRNTDGTSGELPDVMQMDLSRLLEYGNGGLLYDLGEFEGDQLDTSGIEGDLLTSGEVDEQLVAIPTGTNTLAMFYNPEMLDELGVDPPDWDYTWDDFQEFIAEGSAAGADHDPQIYGANDYTMIWWMFMTHLLQQGIEPFSETGEMNFSEDDMRDFISSADSLREPQNVTFPADRTEQLAPLSGFTSHETPVEIGWDNQLNPVTQDSGNDNLQLLPLPSGPGGEKSMFFKPTMQLSMGANTAHPEESAQLIDFLINDTEAGAILGTELGIPSSQPRLDALEVEEGGLDERIMEYEQRVRDEGYDTEPVPAHPDGFGALEAEFTEVLGVEFGYGQIDADTFVDRWFSEAENLLVAW